MFSGESSIVVGKHLFLCKSQSSFFFFQVCQNFVAFEIIACLVIIETQEGVIVLFLFKGSFDKWD